ARWRGLHGSRFRVITDIGMTKPRCRGAAVYRLLRPYARPPHRDAEQDRSEQASWLQSVASLWDSDTLLAQFTSALRYPVFIDGKNYSGAPPLLATRLLPDLFMTSSSQQLRSRWSLAVPAELP